MLRRLFETGVVCRTNEQLAEGTLRHAWSGKEQALDGFDLVVLVGWRVPRDGLARELDGIETHVVGDAVAPRRLADAIREGARAGTAVGRLAEARV